MKDTAITLGHGSGGRQSADLVSHLLESFGKRGIGPEMEDAALLPGGYAMTMDGFTVSPRRFPGGDIGHLCVCGCANDLAVRGASPDFLGISLVLEEGISPEEVSSYMESAASTCAELGMTLAAGDTKVVPSGAVEGMIITGCAFGQIRTPRTLSMSSIREGDALLVTTSVGRHGAAIASARFNLPVEGLLSDCAPLWPALSPLLHLEGLRCMRDCTRGGLGTVLCEWAEASELHFSLDEDSIPVSFQVKSLCDVLGFDPLYMACEGCAALAVAPSDTEETLRILRQSPLCGDAAVIGRVSSAEPKGMVSMRTSIGGERLVDMPWGEILPRIC
ncbi:MAG TPA: hydrogenase expression/formation protein HypE [Aminivibrio sp.]|jgi:hydrogenase expression/formation protein HypE|uniref:hydrogenase expression/formation protein HypE n=1 Tax=Aminivibrio sp. TaxID=1872489 RepID=UPI002CB7C19B|nr:hydrogenase expression/formation protein HypE [Aminivibrio sp.]MDD3515282.1 hydrogenase expression/formation protein HypE [Synergistaceae bacterium]NCB14903.1 hydrogenase expression/formation protein HypE [Synergistales bacterium]HPF85776.1 hydrogenase expression/formation protein HypE [Aminivibrio sp.]HRX26230.1 hydrogenase expression/formation protein HypE [Aminivibrio sp.]